MNLGRFNIDWMFLDVCNYFFLFYVYEGVIQKKINASSIKSRHVR